MRPRIQMHTKSALACRIGIMWCFLYAFLGPPVLFCQGPPDSLTISGSPEIGNTRNQLLERIQYREGTLFRNDFVRDYSPFDERIMRLDTEPSIKDELLFMDAGRENEIVLTAKKNSVSATFIPLLAETFYANGGGNPFWKRSNGLAVSGSIGNDFVFYAKAIDNLLRGASPDMSGSLSSQPGYVRSISGPTGYDYDDTEVQLGYRFSMVQVFFEKIRNTWGYGRGGQLVFSDRAPSYPQVRFSIQLLHNLKLTVLGAFLNSGIIDSSESYVDYTDGTYSKFRTINHSKYLFAHVLEYSPVDELNLAIGEEVVASDRFTPEYLLLPSAFYHNLEIQGVDNNINIWGGGRYTFPHLGSIYSTVYVDNFNADQNYYIVAGTMGATLVDIDHRKLDLTLEYTALRPFVYANDISADDRTTNGYVLGDWLGQNGDRLQAWLDYRPIPQLWLSASYVSIRKGLPGTAAEEYASGNIGGVVGFLDGPIFKRHELDVRGRWEVYSGLFADFSYRLVTQSDQVVDRYRSFSNRSFVSLALKLNIFDQNDEW
jgi:hypothetical protein